MEETHHRTKPNRIPSVLDTSASWLRYHNLKKHMLLFFYNHLFDYNPMSNEIRPHNATLWYPIRSENCETLLDYLKEIYDCITDMNAHESCQDINHIGVFYKDILCLDLDKIDAYFKDLIYYANECDKRLKDDDSEIHNFIKEQTRMLSELKFFKQKLHTICVQWDAIRIPDVFEI